LRQEFGMKPLLDDVPLVGRIIMREALKNAARMLV
jgi:hypothetical protein